MQRSLWTYSLILIDFISASFSWGVFYFLRKTIIEKEDFTIDTNFYLGIFLIPFVWMGIYLLQGTYYDVRRLYRLKIIELTFKSSLIGTLILFFVLLLDDKINNYHFYYSLLLILLSIYFIVTSIPRVILVSYIVKRIQNNKSGFRTLLIGGDKKALSIYNEIKNLPKGIGNDFVGFINLGVSDDVLASKLTFLGNLKDLDKILINSQIEEVIIALESDQHDRLRNIISRIEGGNIKIKISPDMYDILLGSVKMNNIFGALLFEVDSDTMPLFQKILKRIIDLVF